MQPEKLSRAGTEKLWQAGPMVAERRSVGVEAIEESSTAGQGRREACEFVGLSVSGNKNTEAQTQAQMTTKKMFDGFASS
jgi:hypothetical protein